tara:strand:+ start:2878 stop:3879 length:1002 start_codon:yes stop_codon:yes gene_type:complete
MGIIKDCIKGKKTSSIPIWFMRQAGRYLPEFREIRSKNTNFINLCLNPQLSKEITIQPLKRFNIDAAIIFSDILLIPYSLGQYIKFEKDLGPKLDDLNFENIIKSPDEEILKKLNPIYDLLKNTSKEKILSGKDLIGFVGATWTIYVYMLNKKSPKKSLNNDIYNYPNRDDLIQRIIHVQKLHIKKQVENGASLIQIFDSWAGLLSEKKKNQFIYEPTKEIVEFTKSLGVEVICFPRNIQNYKEYCDVVKPNAISIDYNIDPKIISKHIDIPVQGGMDPKILLGDKETLKKEAKRYLDIFKNHAYIFNLGHGVLPETDPSMVDYLVKTVKEYK